MMKEIFSFPLEILDGPSGERNFEMYRAEKRSYIQVPLVDPNFDPMVRRLMEPFEINFEMIHMVSYMRRRVNPQEFDCMNSPVLSSEFWLHRLAEGSGIQGASTHPPVVTSGLMDIQSTIPKNDKSTQTGTETPRGQPINAHRGLPGFNTILQCGTTKLGESMFTVPNAPSVVYNTPTYGRIDRMFGETVESPSRVQTLETVYDVTAKESATHVVSNKPEQPMDPASNSTHSLLISHGASESDTVNSRNRSPLVDLSNAAFPSGIQEMPEVQQRSGSRRMLFEIFHDSYLQPSATKPHCPTSKVLESPAESTLVNSSSFHQSLPRATTGSLVEVNAIPLLKDLSTGKPTTVTSTTPVIFPNADSMDDTAVFELLDYHLAQAQRNSVTSIKSSARFPPAFSVDSPTRLFERLLGNPDPRTTPHK
ncbi:hypothetical protein CRM22_002876 [Opisthorchis felineus]|uniref:Uncharacterized protein n=1 Tax=Opisthorchis felineus TaxID=147828 RepID=A0A4S2M3V8_OPIFE|nr:hypothetical protein CRM22_002876 [Opisthorchis felineus]